MLKSEKKTFAIGSLVFGFLLLGAIYALYSSYHVNKINYFIPILLFLGNIAFRNTSISCYAENMFLLHVIIGFYLILKSIDYQEKKIMYLGFLVLCSSAWIKNEGVLLYLITIMTFIFIYYKDIKSYIFPIITPPIIFIFPWLVVKSSYDIKTYDFNFSYNTLLANVGYIDTILYDFFIFIVNIHNNLGFWIIMFFISILKWKSIIKNKKICFLFLISNITMISYLAIFLFSTRDLHWHLIALSRIMLLPLLLNIMIISLLFSGKKRKIQNI